MPESGPRPLAWTMGFPDNSVGTDSGEFFFTLVLYNTVAADIVKVVDAVNAWKALGVGYDIIIYNV